jgi:phospholipase C
MTAAFTRARTSSVVVTAALLTGAAALVVAASAPASAAAAAKKPPGQLPAGYTNLVVIYEENHSFDNLYGDWGRVGGQMVNGLQNATSATTTQVAQDGTAYQCLLQNDVNLTSPSPLATTCTDAAHSVPASHFTNKWFTIDDYIAPTDKTCPAPGVFAPNGVLKGSGEPGGCTRDLVHRFYQEQYQIDGGKQDRYVTGSDAVGLTMGRYETTTLPIYQYLHSKGAPNYVVADNFFQGAFGGSFLNHQYLVAARAPVVTPVPAGVANSVLDPAGFPNSTYPLYHTTGVVDGAMTVACANGAKSDYVNACGNIAVNTIQPASPPKSSGVAMPLIDDAAYPNIGDRMTAGGITWNWYSGGWDDAAAGHPGPLFQYHHQPFNYFANYAQGAPGRSHLQDETKFIASATNGTLPQVSFVKPYGAENEHPGYASEPDGSDHLVDLLQTIMSGPQAEQTLVVVTYDEFGGQWDHVSPPAVDNWGPGTRIPALVLSAGMVKSGVDHTQYDTTSIMATIEHSFGLAPVASRDAVVNDLAAAVRLGDPRHQGQDGR